MYISKRSRRYFFLLFYSPNSLSLNKDCRDLRPSDFTYTTVTVNKDSRHSLKKKIRGEERSPPESTRN